MPTQLEKERKFLIKLPTSWSDLAELFDSIITVQRISQTYLSPHKGEQAVRIRKTIEGFSDKLKTFYEFNQKKPMETGVHQEKEHKISEQEYHKLLSDADPKKWEVQKTRFVFKWHEQTFELDIFKGHLQGLAILEIELADIDDTIELPDFLKVVKELTDDKSYSNYSLANKDLKHGKEHSSNN
jgi:CYTH domain-containing protein